MPIKTWRFRRRHSDLSYRTRRLFVESLENRCLLAATRLDAPIITGDVSNQYELTSDGQFAVYLADSETLNRTDVFSVEVATGEVRKLHPASQPGTVTQFQISPDDSRVVFQTRHHNDRLQEDLYSVPVTGGEPTQLTPEFVSGGYPTEFRITPDSSRVVYFAQQDLNGVDELFSVPIVGGTVSKVNAPLPSKHDVLRGFDISPDSDRVVYRAGHEAISLYSGNIAGGEVSKLADLQPNRFPPGDDGVAQITPDGRHALYLSDSDLFSVPLTGGDPVQLGQVVQPGFQISPDSADAVFVSGGDLMRASVVGGESEALNPHVSFSTVQPDFLISPDGASVVYRADQDSNFVFELYAVPLAGGASTKLNNLPVAGGDVGLHPGILDFPSFHFTADSQRVVYFADERIDGEVELFSAPLDGTGSTRLSHVAFETEWYSDQLAPVDQRFPLVRFNGSHVVYVADRELYSVPVTGGTAVKLNSPGVIGAQVSGFRLSPVGDRLIYRGMQDNYGVWELYSTPFDGGGVSKLNAPIEQRESAVDSVRVTPDGRYVVYASRDDRESPLELFSVEIATRSTARLTSGESHGGVEKFLLSPDASRVVYWTGDQLYSVPIGGGGAVALHDSPQDWAVGRDFYISGDNRRVVYKARQRIGGAIELFSVPLEGGQPTKLNDPVNGIAHVGSARISPDSRWVVYSPWGEYSLYSVPIEGGLSANLTENPLTELVFSFTPDSSRVVFLGDFVTDGVNELYSVPISGGDVVPLNAPLVKDGEVDRQFTISADSSRVVYLADQETAGVQELYSVPVSGGPATKLNGSLVEGGVFPLAARGDLQANWGGPPPRTDGGDVLSYEVTPDGRRVVYVADQEIDELPELYVVPIVGGPAVKLNGPLNEVGVLPEFVMNPDGSSLVFVVAEDEDEPGDLFAVSLQDGGAAKLDESVVLDRYRSWLWPVIQFAPHSNQVVYRVTLADWKVELRSVSLENRRPGKLTELGNLRQHRISDDGRQVVYIAGGELYAVPVTGGLPERINDPLGNRGFVGNSRFDFELTPDSAQVVYVAKRLGGGTTNLYSQVIPEQPDLVVEAVTPDSTGFTIQFNSQLDATRLNLYDSESANLGESDLIVEGVATGLVSGSLIVDGPKTVRFIKTGGPLQPDTYIVKLRSGPEGFRSVGRYLLNGDASGLAGDDHFASFTVGEHGPVVGLPDFVGGPGESVELSAGGIPLSVSEGLGVRTAAFRVAFDPGLLSFTDVRPGPRMPLGSSVSWVAPSPGIIDVTLTSPSGLPAGEQVLVLLDAQIPDDAEIGAWQVLQLEGVSLGGSDGSLLPVTADHAVQVVSLPGDVSLNGRVNAMDASRIARVAAQLDSGFRRTPRLDPHTVADVNGDGVISAADVLRLLLRLAQFDPDNLPGGSPPSAEPPTPVPPATDSQAGSFPRLDQTAAIVSDVTEFEFTPDGRFAIYLADSVIDEWFELYRVDLATREVVKLTEAGVVGSVLDFQFSPDGCRIVYRTLNAGREVNLYSLSILGGNSDRLNETFGDGQSVGPVARGTNLLFSQDGAHVYYRADQVPSETVDVFSVPIEGGASLRLDGRSQNAGRLWTFPTAAGSSLSVRLDFQSWRGSASLYFINDQGVVFPPGPTNGPEIKVSLDGNWQVLSDGSNVYSRRYSGGLPTRLSDNEGRPEIQDFKISPDSQQVLYLVGDSLYRVPIAGGSRFRFPLAVEPGFEISPDSRHVLLRSDHDLYRFSMAGGQGVLLSSPIEDGTLRVWQRPIQISPDGQSVAFLATLDRVGFGVFVSPISGGGARMVTPVNTYLGGIGDVSFTPDSSRVVYIGQEEREAVSELFSVPAAGGDVEKWSLPHQALAGSVTHAQLSPDGKYLVYRADHDVKDRFELYAVSTATARRVKLNGRLIRHSVEPDFQISPDGSRVLYRARQESVFDIDLHSVWLTGGGDVTVNRHTVEREVLEFRFSPDGEHVIYRAEDRYSPNDGLFRTSIHGGPVTRLDTNGAVRFVIAPDSGHVVYEGPSLGLYSVPIRGGDALQVSEEFSVGGRVRDFQVTRDGKRIVYLQNQGRFGIETLFSVSVAGEDRIRLNGTLHPNVQSFKITPDGRRVLYYVEQTTGLYSVGSAGGKVMKLNGTLAVTSNSFWIAPTSDRVVFRATSGDGPIQLYGVQVSGGSPVRLSDPSQGPVQADPVFSSDGQQILYLVESGGFGDEVVGDLYAVPITASRSATRINPGGKVHTGYRFTSDSEGIVYRADQDVTGVIEAYEARVSGGSPVKINAPLVQGGDVDQVLLLPDVNQAVYLADQDEDGTVGVYWTPLRHPRRTVVTPK